MTGINSAAKIKVVTGKKAESKFSGLLAAVQDRQGDAGELSPAETITAEPRPNVSPIAREQLNSEEPKRGRPRGKRSSEDFVQVTAYIGRDTHRAVKMALLGVGENREFSELVEDLLAKWLERGQ